MTATLAGFNYTLMRAAASLGANPVEAFFRVMLPVIAPGVVSGALFAFVTSFDEVVMALFITGSEQRTLPRQMWSGVRESHQPDHHGGRYPAHRVLDRVADRPPVASASGGAATGGRHRRMMRSRCPR